MCELCEQQAAECSEALQSPALSAGWKQEWASLSSLWKLAPQLIQSEGGGLERETLKAVWPEHQKEPELEERTRT